MKRKSFTERKCANCGRIYMADNRNLQRGWGLCCSKRCAAQKREKSRPDYDPAIVAMNNYKRENGFFDEDSDGIEVLGLDFLLDCGTRD